MNFLTLVKRGEQIIRHNSPIILTAIGVSGTATTAYLAAKGTVEAVKILEDKHQSTVKYLPRRREDIKSVWHCYIPAGVSGVATITAIIAASRAGSRRTAAMAAAYSLSETAFSEYKEKVVEQLGVKKEEAVRDAVAQDRVNANPPSLVIATGKVVCCELYTGRYFECDMETLKKAQNEINHELMNHMYASLNDFYFQVGLEPTSSSCLTGWDSDKLLELKFSTVMSPDSRPCIAFEYNYTKLI